MLWFKYFQRSNTPVRENAHTWDRHKKTRRSSSIVMVRKFKGENRELFI